MKKTIDEVRNELETKRETSAWKNGVKEYALDLLDDLEEAIDYEGKEPSNKKELETLLLNGAKDWKQYSYGGSALIYNGDIARRLCSPSELKKTRNGELRPNSSEDWIDVQTRALYQAFLMLSDILF